MNKVKTKAAEIVGCLALGLDPVLVSATEEDAKAVMDEVVRTLEELGVPHKHGAYGGDSSTAKGDEA